MPVVITTGPGIHQAQSPEGWLINLGNDRLWLIKSCVSALRASRTLLCT